MNTIIMNLIFDNWKMVKYESELLNNFYKYINNSDSIILNINNKNNKYKINDCHNNVNTFLINNNYENYGKILGYYLLINSDNSQILAIQHSVILNKKTNEIFDITPCIYDKKFFIYGYKMPEYKYILYDKSDIKKERTLVYNIDGYIL